MKTIRTILNEIQSDYSSTPQSMPPSITIGSTTPVAPERSDVKERYKETGLTIRHQVTRLSDLQLSAFHLANYYFVFQGVIIAALFNSPPSLRCNHRWFLPTISGLAATMNLFALFIIGTKYIKVHDEYGNTWRDYNELKARLDFPLSGGACPNSRLNGRDSLKKFKHYLVLAICMVFFLSFAVITIFGCANHFCSDRDMIAKSSMRSESCVKICDDLNCIRICTSG